MYRTIPQLHLGAEIEPVKDGTLVDFWEEKEFLTPAPPDQSPPDAENPGFSSNYGLLQLILAYTQIFKSLDF